MTAVCATLSGGERNHLGIQEHTADVQSDNELGCDSCCRWMLARSCAEVGISGWAVRWEEEWNKWVDSHVFC